MTPRRRYAKKRTKAINRRRLNTQQRQQRQQLRAQKKLLGKIFGLMFLTLFGCKSAYKLTCVRGWDKHLSLRLLSALPKRSWLKRLRKLARDVLVPLWRHIESRSPAPRSRWQWPWVWDDSVFRKYGQDFELVGN
jgi:hypothetical protein